MKRRYSLIQTLRTLRRVNLKRDLKRRIWNTWLKVFFLRRYDRKNSRANILGFTVKFLDHRHLSHLYDEIFLNNEYYCAVENDHPYIVDCGSNIGMSIVYFKALYPESRILAFEPGEEPFSCLEENIRNNGFSTSVELHKAAVSSQEGTIDLYYDPDKLGALIMSIKQERMPKQKRPVKAVRLSSYITQEVDLLKMDIEGAELEVIEELSHAGKLILARQMVIEYHHHIKREDDLFSRLLRILEDSGFGYQIESHLVRPHQGEALQDILVHAYRKKGVA